jgi:hypothetical protein
MHTNTLTARSRVARRSREGGAVMFIVAMTLALLAAMGAYALAIAATEVKTSGYLRQAVQTHYLSEWAVLGAAEELGLNGQNQLRQMLSPATDVPSMLGKCASITAVPPTGTGLPASSQYNTACEVLTSAPYTASQASLFQPPMAFPWQPLNGTGAPNNIPIEPFQTAASPGDEGLPTAPSFAAELTDPIKMQVANSNSGGGNNIQQPACVFMVTITSSGLTPPNGAAASVGSEGLEQAKAHVIIAPPVPCPGGS